MRSSLVRRDELQGIVVEQRDARDGEQCAPIRVAHLIAIFGAATSGKSTLMEGLRSGTLPELATRLEIDDASAWPSATRVQLEKLRGERLPKLLFHYAWSVPIKAYLDGECSALTDRRWPRHAEVLDLLSSADRVTYVIVWAEPEVLHARTRQRKFRIFLKWERLRNPVGFVSRFRKIRGRQRQFGQHRERLLQFYDELIGFCEGHVGARTWIFDPLEEPARLYKPIEWAAR